MIKYAKSTDVICFLFLDFGTIFIGMNHSIFPHVHKKLIEINRSITLIEQEQYHGKGYFKDTNSLRIIVSNILDNTCNY